MTEHIDIKRINSDLRYRFECIAKFLNFTSDDIAMLNTFAPLVFPLIPVLADTVYRKLFSFDITKQYFLKRNERFEGFLPKKQCGLTLESAPVVLRKDMVGIYLKRVLTEHEWNDTFLQYLSQIGKLHTDEAGSASLNVDYIHINALLGYLENVLIKTVCNIDTMDEKTKCGILMAVNKLFWIQNDLFTMHFLRALNNNGASQNSTEKDKTTTCCWA
ncbi:unnamed protein product [Rotaria magnacalcarata]|uniref:Globin-sensor domain-containing protein n=3 Tax=Rotaria magnacalcarata TaxID=392030 RepID=A0A815TQ26_9BILA|nr:unnamed protein product [Rotaria magnacalcarata]CAF1509598.1 unnamed protein product [Rotaria magnacalcarata]CAF1924037.1 unnamed protein product [Rotaria magnacalcarata]CAF1927431.1 unnamed protein product [Rotaria magnacalcarata]CAF4176411.1 unnamed protein product [Rotaria magnacalcarata]